MTDPTNNRAVDRFLRKAAGDPAPTAANRRYVERVLDRAIREAEPIRRRNRSPWRWRAPALAGSLALIVAVALVVQVTRPSPASAALNEIAAAAELIEPIRIPDQSYAYTRSQGTVLSIVPPDDIDARSGPLAYLLPQTREVWIAGTGTVQISTTTHTPVFFTVEDETDYYSAGLDAIDQINSTVTLTGTGLTSILDERDWPANHNDLRTAIIESLPDETQQPREVAIANIALNLIAETGASPQLKAAAVRLISTLDTIDLSERRSDGGGTFTIDFNQPQPTSLAFTLDGAGNLVQFSLVDIGGDTAMGIPPGTKTENTSYEPTTIVDGLDSP